MGTAPALLLMACSATKLTHAAPALHLYRGVMYGTFRANVPPACRPHVVILSALHGFIGADQVIEPYEQRMTRERADLMVSRLEDFVQVDWPTHAGRVMLAGGADYRRVMLAAVNRMRAKGTLAADATIIETTGGIGYQRQQLGAFLRELAPSAEIVGHHANGTPLYRTLGGFTIEQTVTLAYPGRPENEAEPAVIAELFEGPGGPSANVRLANSSKPHLAYTWVRLKHLRPG